MNSWSRVSSIASRVTKIERRNVEQIRRRRQQIERGVDGREDLSIECQRDVTIIGRGIDRIRRRREILAMKGKLIGTVEKGSAYQAADIEHFAVHIACFGGRREVHMTVCIARKSGRVLVVLLFRGGDSWRLLPATVPVASANFVKSGAANCHRGLKRPLAGLSPIFIKSETSAPPRSGALDAIPVRTRVRFRAWVRRTGSGQDAVAEYSVENIEATEQARRCAVEQTYVTHGIRVQIDGHMPQTFAAGNDNEQCSAVAGFSIQIDVDQARIDGDRTAEQSVEIEVADKTADSIETTTVMVTIGCVVG